MSAVSKAVTKAAKKTAKTRKAKVKNVEVIKKFVDRKSGDGLTILSYNVGRKKEPKYALFYRNLKSDSKAALPLTKEQVEKHKNAASMGHLQAALFRNEVKKIADHLDRNHGRLSQKQLDFLKKRSPFYHPRDKHLLKQLQTAAKERAKLYMRLKKSKDERVKRNLAAMNKYIERLKKDLYSGYLNTR